MTSSVSLVICAIVIVEASTFGSLAAYVFPGATLVPDSHHGEVIFPWRLKGIVCGHRRRPRTAMQKKNNRVAAIFPAGYGYPLR